jgi:hypothetical protein
VTPYCTSSATIIAAAPSAIARARDPDHMDAAARTRGPAPHAHRDYARRMRLLAIATLAACACDGLYADQARDAGDALGPAEECQAIYDRVTAAIMGADRTCATVDDCTLRGGVSTCDCTTFLGVACTGDPLSEAGNAAVAAATDDAVVRYRSLGCEVGGRVCDCAPGIVDCVDGACRLVGEHACFPPPDADAGVDAP